MNDHIPFIDAHYHFAYMVNDATIENLDYAVQVIKDNNLAAMNTLALITWEEKEFLRNLLALLLKAENPGVVYGFIGLEHPKPENASLPNGFLEQVKRSMEMGFDGIKMFAKPTVRKAFGVPIDSPVYDPMLKYCEEKAIPIIYHVADPSNAWDPEKATPIMRERGWFFDETFPTYEDFYTETFNMLKKFPKLNVAFAHLFFLSGDIKRAQWVLDTWENVKYDLTPGTEAYVDFSADIQKWRDFFIKNADRFIVGTDNSAQNAAGLELAAGKINFLRKFFGTSEVFTFENKTFTGLGLDDVVLKKIFGDNFKAIAGEKPKVVNLELAIADCDRIAGLIENSPYANSKFSDEIKLIKTRFEKLTAK